jgi:hypothetical protein
VGKLIPGEALIYERANGVTYARYRDPPHNKKPRWAVGGIEPKVHDAGYWFNVVRAAEDNKLLQDALNRVKIIYELSKKDQDG